MSNVSSRLHLSDIAPATIQSEIRSMSVGCDRVGGISLAQGICDTDLPSVVASSAIEAIRDGHNIYTRLDGIASLRQGIAEKLECGLRLSAAPDVLQPAPRGWNCSESDEYPNRRR